MLQVNILLKLKSFDHVSLNFPNMLQVNLGNGEETLFSEDRWHESGVLKSIYPRLYALESDKSVKVKDRIIKKWKTGTGEGMFAEDERKKRRSRYKTFVHRRL